MNAETVITRKQTAFRLSDDLLGRLRLAARKENRSLNNFVESALIDLVYRYPNETTSEAIKEAQEGRFAGTISTRSMDAFIKSCEK